MLPSGRITGARTIVEPQRLAAARREISRADLDLAAGFAQAGTTPLGALLEEYGLSLQSVSSLRLREPARRGSGKLESEHRGHLILTSALASLAVAATARGSLLSLPESERAAALRTAKEANDRAAACALAEGLLAFVEAAPEATIEIAVGEGAGLKPGEKGGNPTLYAGQRFGDAKLAALGREERRRRGVLPYAMAVDAVDGTTNSALARPSAISLFYITESPILPIPDVYLNKCHAPGVPGIHVDMDLREILLAIAEARGTDEINVFSMDRPRHPLREMAAMGANVRTDTFGDVLPAVATALPWGVFEDNHRPLDAVCGNIGGAAELIAAMGAGHHLGVRSTARFAARKIDRWEERYRLEGEHEARLRALGLDPARVYATEDLIPEIDRCEGAFVASAVTDGIHVPLMDGAVWGERSAEVAVLFVGASGAADLSRLSFSFLQDAATAAARLTPILERLLATPPEEMPRQIRDALRSPSGPRRLRHEFATSFYAHFTEEAGRYRLDMRSAEAVESPEALAFLRALTDAADWFA